MYLTHHLFGKLFYKQITDETRQDQKFLSMYAEPKNEDTSRCIGELDRESHHREFSNAAIIKNMRERERDEQNLHVGKIFAA